jgi:hypothetical protein
MSKYDNLYDKDGKFKGGYWQFAINNKNIYYFLFLFLFATGANIHLYIDDGRLYWWSALFYIPFLAMCYGHYRHWREIQEGRTS